MNEDTKKMARTKITVGLDLGDRFSQVCVLDAEGQIIEEGRVATTPAALEQRFGSGPSARIALEVGTHSPWVSRQLQSYGHEVIVANPRRLRLIYENTNKSDRVDAQYLARLARLDPRLLSPVRHRTEETQTHLALLRARAALVEARTQLVNHARGAVKSMGSRLPSCSTETFPKKVREHLPPPLAPVLDPLLGQIETLTGRIRLFDGQIETVSEERYPETKRLRQVVGVGPLTALAFVLVLQDPLRFKKSREVGPYLGLVRRKAQTGESDPELRISKAGDVFLRSLLVGCAHYILGPFGPDSDLRRYGTAMVDKGGPYAKKRAIVAVARKLAVLLHHLWVTSQDYEPLHNRQRPQGQKAA